MVYTLCRYSIICGKYTGIIHPKLFAIAKQCGHLIKPSNNYSNAFSQSAIAEVAKVKTYTIIVMMKQTSIINQSFTIR